MRIKIGDDFLDSFNDEIIAQTYAVNEIGQIELRQGGFSNDFELPLTAINRAILGIPDEINSTSRTPYQKVDCDLVDVGAVIASGYLRYKVVSSTIKVSFFSDNVEWFTLIRDKKLTDLELSQYDHNWDYQTISAAINADKSSGYTYPLIDYGEFRLSTELDVDTTQMFPAVFVSTVMKQIFYDVGWKIDGPITLHPLYTRMVVPFSGKSFSHSSQYIEDNRQIATTPPGASVFSTPGTDYVSFTVSDKFFTVTAPGLYLITSSIIVLSSPAGSGFSVFLRKNSTVISNTNFYLPDTNGVISVSSLGAIQLEIGDQISIGVIIGASITVTSVEGGTTVTLTPDRTIGRGSEIQVSQILPDIKQSDFVRYIAFIFGAIPQANNFSKTVTFSFFKSVKDNLVNALDWSNKIDMSVQPELDYTQLLSNYASKSIFTYKEDTNDEELIAYEDETGKRFGQGQFDIDNDFIREESVVYEAPFSPMININSFNNQIYIPQIRFKVTGGTDLTPVPKIAILSENITVSELTNGLFNRLRIYDDTDEYATDYEDVTSIPFCWFAKTEYTQSVDALTDTLAFDQVEFPNAIGNPIIDTFLTDYEDILNEIKYVKANFHLNESDISGLDFTIPVYVDRFKAYFFRSKIEDYQGSRQSTSVELVKIV